MAFNEKYQPAKEDTEEPIYGVELGKDTFTWYPEEMQVILRELAAEVKRDNQSKTTPYDMTRGYLYKIMLFDDREEEEWQETLKKVKGDDDFVTVGAQWDAKKATEEPPGKFEKGVMYRPVSIKARTR